MEFGEFTWQFGLAIFLLGIVLNREHKRAMFKKNTKKYKKKFRKVISGLLTKIFDFRKFGSNNNGKNHYLKTFLHLLQLIISQLKSMRS